MLYDVHVPVPTFGYMVHEFEHTPLGNAVVSGFARNFDSASEIIGASYTNAGGGTNVNLPNGNVLNFDNVPRFRLANVIRAVMAYFGGQQ